MSEHVEVDGDGVPKEAEGFSERERAANRPGETGTEKPKTRTKKRDWVTDAYETFVKNAEGLDPTDPVAAISAYFEKNATDELKERCKAEKKTAAMCWKFIEAVARKVGGNCHIDPGAVYAMAMHFFEDVPADWNAAAYNAAGIPKPKAEKKAKPKKPAETPSEIKKEKAKAAKKKVRKVRQGFFFEMLDAPAEVLSEGGAA